MKKIIITEDKLKKVILEQDDYFNIGDYDDTWESRIVNRDHDISGGRMFSPDYAKDEFGYHSCRSRNAYCFLFQYGDENNGENIIIGNPGESHRRTYYNLYAQKNGYENFTEYIRATRKKFSEVGQEISKFVKSQRFVEGRIWPEGGKNFLFAFWELPSNKYELSKCINGVLNKIGADINSSNINIALEDKVISYDDMVNNYESSLERQRVIKPAIQKIKNVHLMGAKEKDEALRDAKVAKFRKFGKDLAMHDKEGNFTSEMPMAQWRALHSTSENRKRNKKIINDK